MNRGAGAAPRHAQLWRLGYIAVILLATLLDSGLTTQGGIADRWARALQPSLTGRDAIDAVRNVILFAGWGSVWTLTSRHANRINTIIGAAVTGLILSATVESAQLFAVRRTASVLDLITNGAGALIGAIVTVLLAASVRARKNTRSFVGMPMLVFAMAYGGAALLEALSPVFRQDRLPVWGNPFERLRITLSLAEPFRWAEAPLLDLLLFAPAAGFVVAALVERGVSYQRAALLVSVAGAVAAISAELARGLVGYTLSWSPPIVHVCALVGGAWLTAVLLPRATRALRGRHRPMVLYLFYIPLLALWNWRPFVFERGMARIAEKLSLDRFIPLYAYRERVDLFSAADALIPVLLFFPLGCLLVVWPLRRHGPFGLLLPALWLAIVLEFTQILLAGRLFDVTDILLQLAGAGLGWVLLRQAGFSAYGEVMKDTERTEKTDRSPRSAQRAQRTN